MTQLNDAVVEFVANAEALAGFIAEAKRLRTSVAEAEADFFSHLSGGEVTLESEWREAGYLTFAALLDAENLCRPARFEAFKAAVARFGLEHVRSVGVDSIRIVLGIPGSAASLDESRDEGAAAATLADLEAFRTRNATPPSEQQARAIARRHYDPSSTPRAPSALAIRARELEAENAALRSQVEALTAENAALRERIGGVQDPGTARMSENASDPKKMRPNQRAAIARKALAPAT